MWNRTELYRVAVLFGEVRQTGEQKNKYRQEHQEHR